MLYRMALSFLAVFVCVAPNAVAANLETRCITPENCFCVTTSFETVIAEKVKLFRERIAQAISNGKYVGYLSVPLSGRAGGYFPLNIEAANRFESQVLARLGAASTWLLNPGSKEADMFVDGVNASQADYMYMWTQVLLGEDKSGKEIDFVYFAGLGDFANFFGLGDADRLGQLGTYFDKRQQADKDFAKAVADGKLNKRDFVSYYGLRAGAAFSSGAHDEWNLVVAINKARRAANLKEGIPRQIPMLFSGQPVEPGDFEDTIAVGNVGKCPGG